MNTVKFVDYIFCMSTNQDGQPYSAMACRDTGTCMFEHKNIFWSQWCVSEVTIQYYY